MLKLYKWLGTCNVRPYKKYGHFIKWLGILNNYLNQMSEKKRKKNNRNPYLAPRRVPASRPSQPTKGTGVFFPNAAPQAARWKATRAADASRAVPVLHLPLPTLLEAPQRCPLHAASIPPSRAAPALSLAEPHEEQNAAIGMA